MLQTLDLCAEKTEFFLSLTEAKASTAPLFRLSHVGKLAVNDKDRVFPLKTSFVPLPIPSVAESKFCNLGEDPLTFRDILIYMLLKYKSTLIDAIYP